MAHAMASVSGAAPSLEKLSLSTASSLSMSRSSFVSSPALVACRPVALSAKCGPSVAVVTAQAVADVAAPAAASQRPSGLLSGTDPAWKLGTADKARLKTYYETAVVPAMLAEFGYANPQEVPRVEKVVVNCGIGDASQSAKTLDSAAKDLAAVTGQRPVVTRARKAIAGFKLRAGVPVGMATTLRGQIMYAYLDRLINLALPRMRDFRGVSRGGFDGRGNYSMGLAEQTLYPEIRYDEIDKTRGMDISIVTTAKTDGEAQRLLELLGVPFREGPVPVKEAKSKGKGRGRGRGVAERIRFRKPTKRCNVSRQLLIMPESGPCIRGDDSAGNRSARLDLNLEYSAQPCIAELCAEQRAEGCAGAGRGYSDTAAAVGEPPAGDDTAGSGETAVGGECGGAEAEESDGGDAEEPAALDDLVGRASRFAQRLAQRRLQAAGERAGGDAQAGGRGGGGGNSSGGAGAGGREGADHTRAGGTAGGSGEGGVGGSGGNTGGGFQAILTAIGAGEDDEGAGGDGDTDNDCDNSEDEDKEESGDTSEDTSSNDSDDSDAEEEGEGEDKSESSSGESSDEDDNSEDDSSEDDNSGGSDRCHLAQSFLPCDGPMVVDKVASRAYIGQFSGDGDLFVAGFQDRRIRVYDVDRGWSLRKDVIARNLRWTITDTALSPDQRFLVYASITPIVHLVNVGYGSGEVESLANVTDIHEELNFTAVESRRRERSFGIWSLQFSSDGRELIAGSSDRSLYVFDLERNQPILRVKAHQDDVNAVAFADETSQLIFSGSDDRICKVWDRRLLDNTEPIGPLRLLDPVGPMHIGGDARCFLTNGKDQTMKLWDIRVMMDPAAYEDLPPPRIPFFQWDYRWMDYPGRGMRVAHPNDQSLMTYRNHHVLQTLIRCYFSPLHSTAQRFVYSGSHDGAVYIYDLTLIRCYFSPLHSTAQRFVYSGSHDGAVYFFDLMTGKQVAKLKHHGSTVRDCCWHPTRPSLASVGWDGKVAVWESFHGDTQPTFSPPWFPSHSPS
ncbi:unnamed protein product [Closterium sp. Yama58-4]|nr:unnamed protein product [Closterium sp. Yama58-4]